MDFTKEQFTSVLSALKSQYDYDKAKTKKLTEIYGVDVMPSDNSRLTNEIFKMLHIQFPPNGGFCEIQHFCYELDFGRESGLSIDGLWDLLTKTK